MKPKQLVICGCTLAALAVLPAMSAKAAARECIVQKPSPASYTWNFRREANAVFKDIQFDAAQAKYHAGRLQSIASRPDAVSWVSDVSQFDQIRVAVDDMGRQLCRLETIRRVVEPWQQKTIDRIATDLTLLADNTQHALAFGDTHRETLWVPAFQRYLNRMCAEARDLTQSANDAVKYAKVDRQDRALRREVNARSSS